MRRDDMKQYALYLAWTVSLIGLILSLYYGEIVQIEPCRLCWYQRIALFPLVLILGVAAYKNDRKVVIYAMPLAVIGGLFAVYQMLGQWFPILLNSSVCGHDKECGVAVFSLFGFIHFPMLSSLGFALIATFLLLAQKK